MLLQKSKYLGYEAVQIWWPASARDVTAHLDRVPVVVLWQCPESLAHELRRWVFHRRPFATPLVDLTRTEEELWHKLEPKSCRYEIHKAQKLDCAISCNKDTEAARLLLNDSIRRLQYRTELGDAEWQALLPVNDIFLCTVQGMPIATHAVLRDPPARVKLLLSGGADRADKRFRNLVGPCNRLLHWHELQHYKAQGFHYYDFGGIDLRENSSEPKPTFKLSFGGEVGTRADRVSGQESCLACRFRWLCRGSAGLEEDPLARCLDQRSSGKAQTHFLVPLASPPVPSRGGGGWK